MFENWLKPLSAAFIKTIPCPEPTCLGNTIAYYESGSGQLLPGSVAIIGLDQQNANAVRSYLYPLNNPWGNVRVIDMGNVRKSSKSFIVPVIKELLDSQVFMVFLGGDDQLMVSQYLGYQEKRKTVNVAIVNQKIPYDPEGTIDTSPLNEIINKERKHLFYLSLIGYQTHYTSSNILEAFDRHLFEYWRLGFVKQHMQELEPVVRDADLFCFNLGALKLSDAPGQQEASPSGFTSEEACQLCRYAGLSDKLTSAGFFGFKIDSSDTITPQVVAQMSWYLLDGYFSRKQDFPVSTDGLVEYIVDSKAFDFQISFWKSTKSGRWWMQVPVHKNKKSYRHRMVPCSYEDYLKTSNEDFPDRLLNAIRRFS